MGTSALFLTTTSSFYSSTKRNLGRCGVILSLYHRLLNFHSITDLNIALPDDLLFELDHIAAACPLLTTLEISKLTSIPASATRVSEPLKLETFRLSLGPLRTYLRIAQPLPRRVIGKIDDLGHLWVQRMFRIWTRTSNSRCICRLDEFRNGDVTVL